MNKDEISGSQLTMLLIAYLLGSSLVSGSGLVVHSVWLANILGTLESLLFALAYIALTERFDHKSLAAVTRQVFGRVAGPLISLVFLWFVVQLGGLVLGHFGFYFNITVMQRSPTAWFIIPLAIVSAYSAYAGIDTTARATTLLLPVTILLLFTLTAMLVPQMRATNLLPIVDTDLKTLLMAAHGSAMLPLAESAVFILVIPHLRRTNRAGKPILTGLVLGGLMLTLVNFTNVALLGAGIKNTIFPAHAAASLIEVGEVFTRMEILVAINFLSMGFVKTVVLVYGAAVGLAETLGLQSHKPLVLPLVAIMVILALTGFHDGYGESMVFVATVWPFYVPPFVLGIPLLVLVAALITKQPQKKRK